MIGIYRDQVNGYGQKVREVLGGCIIENWYGGVMVSKFLVYASEYRR